MTEEQETPNPFESSSAPQESCQQTLPPLNWKWRMTAAAVMAGFAVFNIATTVAAAWGEFLQFVDDRATVYAMAMLLILIYVLVVTLLFAVASLVWIGGAQRVAAYISLAAFLSVLGIRPLCWLLF